MSKKIQVLYTPHFLKKYAKLEKDIQAEVKDKTELFKNTLNHSSLKVHKLKSFGNTYSFSVNYKIRIVFEYGKNKNSAHFLHIGNHDEVY